MRLTHGRRLRARLAILMASAAVGLLVTSCSRAAPSPNQASRNGVITLNHISALKSLFNRDNGHPRLVLIFSPT